MSPQDSQPRKPVSPAPQTPPRDADQNEIPLEDLEKVSGGGYVPGRTPPPAPPPRHRSE